jgi:hypothetical protein
MEKERTDKRDTKYRWGTEIQELQFVEVDRILRPCQSGITGFPPGQTSSKQLTIIPSYEHTESKQIYCKHERSGGKGVFDN